jgi:hypothetical protein
MNTRLSILILSLTLCSTAFARADQSSSPILFIGDSISYGKFGETVDTALRDLSKNVVSEASCGSTPETWLTKPGQSGHTYAKTVCGFWKKAESEEREKVHNTPKIEEELRSIHPKFTIVQLGTNIAAGRDPMTYKASVQQMMQAIRSAGSQCIWIGPPDADSKVVTRAKLTVTNEMIRSEAKSEGCSFIDTLSFTHYTSKLGDGIHPGPQLAEDWADEVNQRMIPLIKSAMQEHSVHEGQVSAPSTGSSAGGGI